MAKLQPEPAPIEVREGDEEVGHRALLAAEEIEEAVGGLACSRHALIVARELEPSWNARIRRLERMGAGGLLPPKAGSRRVSAAVRIRRRHVIRIRCPASVVVSRFSLGDGPACGSATQIEMRSASGGARCDES